jgi:hypothetical protein
MSVRHREGSLDISADFILESKTYKYTLDEELIGDGGYGQVYEAVTVLKRQVIFALRLSVRFINCVASSRGATRPETSLPGKRQPMT